MLTDNYETNYMNSTHPFIHKLNGSLLYAAFTQRHERLGGVEGLCEGDARRNPNQQLIPKTFRRYVHQVFGVNVTLEKRIFLSFSIKRTKPP